MATVANNNLKTEPVSPTQMQNVIRVTQKIIQLSHKQECCNSEYQHDKAILIFSRQDDYEDAIIFL